MAKYRKISQKIWNDAKFRALSDNAKLVFFMLLTHPQTSALGTLRAFPQGLAPEIGWSEKDFRQAFQEVIDKGMVKCAERAGLIWLPNFMRYNAPESPNVLKSWAGALDDCPECALKNEVFESVRAFSEGMKEPFRKAFQDTFRQPSPNQEQEQEQEQNTPLTPQRGKRAAKKDYSEEFELFWREYPNHKSGKPNAYSAFCKAREKTDLETILKSVEEHKKSSQWTKNDGDYIPHATTWLNQQRWTAEVETQLSDGRFIDEDGIVWSGTKYVCKN